MLLVLWETGLLYFHYFLIFLGLRAETHRYTSLNHAGAIRIGEFLLPATKCSQSINVMFTCPNFNGNLQHAGGEGKRRTLRRAKACLFLVMETSSQEVIL